MEISNKFSLIADLGFFSGFGIVGLGVVSSPSRVGRLTGIVAHGGKLGASLSQTSS